MFTTHKRKKKKKNVNIKKSANNGFTMDNGYELN